MVRKEYWEQSKELIEWCNESELKVLTQQAEKALNKRMEQYLGKHEYEEKEAKKAKDRDIKKRMRQKSKVISK